MEAVALDMGEVEVLSPSARAFDSKDDMGSICMFSVDLLPKFKPSKFVVGVPVIIHLLSTLRSFANGTKFVDRVEDTWPSSMTRRFHLICRKGETERI